MFASAINAAPVTSLVHLTLIARPLGIGPRNAGNDRIAVGGLDHFAGHLGAAGAEVPMHHTVIDLAPEGEGTFPSAGANGHIQGAGALQDPEVQEDGSGGCGEVAIHAFRVARPSSVIVYTVRVRCPTDSWRAVASPCSTSFFGSAYSSRSDLGHAKRKLRDACCVSS